MSAERPESEVDRLERALKRVTGAVGDLQDITDAGLDGNFRVAKQLVAAVEDLHKTSKATADSNERTAARLIKLTWALLVLTAVIAVLTAAFLLRPSG